MQFQRLLWPPVAVGCLGSLCGCANLNSIYRPIGLGSLKEGAAVSLDVKQRALLSAPQFADNGEKDADQDEDRQRRGKRVMFCSEPSPDALTALSTSGGLGVATPNGAQVQGALAAAESAASIGLRTQSIQLLRDGLFANCLAYMNGLTHKQYYELQRRSQIFTLGLLSIEQLTGAVRAQQATLGGSAAAATGSENTDKEAAAVDEAQKNTISAQKDEDDAELAVTQARRALDEQQIKVDAAKKVVDNPPKDATPDQIKQASTDYASEKATRDSKRDDVDSAVITRKEKQALLVSAQKNESNAKAALLAAKGRVSALVSSSANLAEAQRASPEIAKHVAEAVSSIVNAVLEESGRNEECNSYINATAKDSISDDAMAYRWAKQVSLICSTGNIASSTAIDLSGAKALGEKEPIYLNRSLTNPLSVPDPAASHPTGDKPPKK